LSVVGDQAGAKVTGIVCRLDAADDERLLDVGVLPAWNIRVEVLYLLDQVASVAISAFAGR
jgi:hypothetical protein